MSNSGGKRSGDPLSVRLTWPGGERERAPDARRAQSSPARPSQGDDGTDEDDQAVGLAAPRDTDRGDRGALDDLRAAIDGLRRDVGALQDLLDRDPQPPSGGTGDATDGTDAPSVAAELEAMRTELTRLRRRITLRAGDGPELAPEQLEALAERVVDRLVAVLGEPDPG